ncbi:hypothetical protein N3K66_008725 [Trichothecium roseum]|uniref:Uncharacterized protein n=1 Tax=Trichothecium roseum TaxID=47278 RepID=A0ACC0UR04_9HYPO|nr:hypothetical protein N3K66_008725 [Trichothecium roseum]
MKSLQTALCLSAVAVASAQTPEPYSSHWNSSFALSDAQIQEAGLSDQTVSSINTILNYERTLLANGGPREDDFYTLPPQTNATVNLEAGKLLKIQEVTDPAPYTLVAGSSLSKILYTTKTFNGTIVPASAFILWPYSPRQFGDEDGGKAATLLWTHGTSGYFADNAPSAFRTLQYENIAIFPLVQAGYAVVAPDYAGLGVGKTWNGNEIPHEYFNSPSGANDALYAMRAALDAFEDRLSGKFAVAGHSQGGGVAWATAEALAIESADFKELSKGYVGTIAGAPVTDGLNLAPFATILAARGMTQVFPDFTLDQWLTPLAEQRLELQTELQGSSTVGQYIYPAEPVEDILKPGWYNSSYHGAAFSKLGDAGRKPFASPMLVLQGTNDPFVNHNITTKAISDTCESQDGVDLEYVIVNGGGHTPMLSTIQRTWLKWLEDRFEGRELVKGCKRSDLNGWLGNDKHFLGSNGLVQFVGTPEFTYQNFGGV